MAPTCTSAGSQTNSTADGSGHPDQVDRQRIAHDLINELNLLVYANEELQEEAGTPRTRQATDLIELVVGRILDFLRNEVRRGEVRSGCDGAAMLRETALLWGQAMRQRELRLELSAPDAPAWLPLPADDWRTVVSNLLSNAAKYTPQGGSISVALEHLEAEVRLVVADTGPGIPVELQARLFEAPVRGDTSVPGNGVGLHQVADLLKKVGGSITCATRPGWGAAFQVVVPLAASAGGVVAEVANTAVTTWPT